MSSHCLHARANIVESDALCTVTLPDSPIRGRLLDARCQLAV